MNCTAQCHLYCDSLHAMYCTVPLVLSQSTCTVVYSTTCTVAFYMNCTAQCHLYCDSLHELYRHKYVCSLSSQITRCVEGAEIANTNSVTFTLDPTKAARLSAYTGSR